MLAALLTLLITFAGVSSSVCEAQEVGDRVVVMASTDTKIVKERVDRVVAGSIHTVIAINGKWCALNDVRGWLELRLVMNLDMAKDQYDERIDDNDNDWEAYATRGMIYREMDQLPRAFTDLNRSLQINKLNARTWNNRGVVLKDQGQYQLALKDILYALQLDPKHSHSHFNLGTVYYSMNRFEDAIASYDKAIELHPKNAWYYINRGSAKHSMGDEAGALEDYDQSIQLDKRMADAFVGKSNVYLGRNDLDNALKFVNEAVEVQPRNAMALNARGWILYKQGDYDDALADYDQSVRFAPRLPVTYNNRGVCYSAKEDFVRAIDDYSRSLELVSQSPITHSNRGTAYFNSGDYEKADEDFKLAVETGAGLAEPLNATAWFRSVCPEDNYRDGESAVELATKACELTGWKDWTVVDTLAAAQAEKGEFDEAGKNAAKAMELAPAGKQDVCGKRLALYESGKPYRSDVGKTADPDQSGRRNPATEDTEEP